MNLDTKAQFFFVSQCSKTSLYVNFLIEEYSTYFNVKKLIFIFPTYYTVKVNRVHSIRFFNKISVNEKLWDRQNFLKSVVICRSKLFLNIINE